MKYPCFYNYSQEITWEVSYETLLSIIGYEVNCFINNKINFCCFFYSTLSWLDIFFISVFFAIQFSESPSYKCLWAHYWECLACLACLTGRFFTIEPVCLTLNFSRLELFKSAAKMKEDSCSFFLLNISAEDLCVGNLLASMFIIHAQCNA